MALQFLVSINYHLECAWTTLENHNNDLNNFSASLSWTILENQNNNLNKFVASLSIYCFKSIINNWMLSLSDAIPQVS